MKVEMQSVSSDIDDFEDSKVQPRSSSREKKKKLWTSTKRGSSSAHSSSGFVTQRNGSNVTDDDFEFVITSSKNAMKVKKSSLDQSDSYRRFTDGLDPSRKASTRFTKHPDSPRQKPRRPRHSNYRPVGHPGLDRKIDFDPFDSSSEGSLDENESDAGSFQSESVFNSYTRLKPPQFAQDNSPQFESNYSTFSVSTPRYSHFGRPRIKCRKILSKLKFFFKSVGFKLKKCFSRSKTYLSRMIKERKTKRKNRKERDRLLENQQLYTDVDQEPITPPKQKTVYRRKMVVPFNLNSNSTSSFEDIDTPKPPKKSKFERFRFGRRKSKNANPHMGTQHVKLHSFPDG